MFFKNCWLCGRIPYPLVRAGGEYSPAKGPEPGVDQGFRKGRMIHIFKTPRIVSEKPFTARLCDTVAAQVRLDAPQ